MKKNNLNIYGQRFAWGALLFFVACMSACRSDNGDVSSAEYDPSRPVTVTDFIPKEGGVDQKLVVYGSNFGNSGIGSRIG